jgi:hypothetical protein
METDTPEIIEEDTVIPARKHFGSWIESRFLPVLLLVDEDE